MTKQEFISTYYKDAVQATKGTKLFPETLITQLILESGYNLSNLAKVYNNFFGIKATPKWSGKVVSLTTKEYNSNGTSYSVVGTGKTYNNYNSAVASGANKMSLFRIYNSPKDSFKGWVNFLQVNPRYKKVFFATTPEAQFKELQNAGYATSPTYANQLTEIYNDLKPYIPAIAAGGGGLLLLIGLAYYLSK